MSSSVDVAKEYLDKWLPRFGFGHYRTKVSVLPLSLKGETWARCFWVHDEEFARFQFIPDGVLPPKQIETLVLHELAHGLIKLAERSNPDEETVCNRIARLCLPTTKLANEHALCGATWENSDMDPELVRLFVDTLPEQERDVINRRFYEQQSLGTIQKDLGLKYPQDVVRIIKRATGRMKMMIED